MEKEIKEGEYIIFLKTSKNTVAQVMLTKDQNIIISSLISSLCDGKVKIADEIPVVYDV
ncbi:MAG: hypothetical protein ACLRVU_01125 [Beduini sp.]|uniref:hypothetical protein n=1 Tax=Beduini sp. TaxID=1922300 RepID=UPI0039A074F7